MIKADDKLADIVYGNIDLLPIVFRFGISQNLGQNTIREICLERNVDMDFFLSVVNTYNSVDYFPNSETTDLSLLIDFLTKTHDYHKDVTIPRLRGLLSDLKSKIPDIRLVNVLEEYLNSYIEKLLDHILFEEANIFPLVSKTKYKLVDAHGKESLNHLHKLFSQHTNVETELSDLIIIIIQHIPDNFNVQLFHEILHTLTHFEKEQLDHARFEDKILVPRLLRQLTA
jgi:regulator of cell morphogenesis and NO signaling